MGPLRSGEKNVIFEDNSHDLVHSFCLRRPLKLRRPISTKNRGEGAPLNCHVDLSIFSLFCPLFSFTLSFFSSFFGATLVTRGARAPKAPQDTPLNCGYSGFFCFEITLICQVCHLHVLWSECEDKYV